MELKTYFAQEFAIKDLEESQILSWDGVLQETMVLEAKKYPLKTFL